MIIFDNEYLKQYIELGTLPEVYVNGQWYQVTELSDVESPEYGIGINVQGKSTTFRYPQIQQVKADGHIITIDQLNDKATGQEGGGEEDTSGIDKKTGKPLGGGGGGDTGGGAAAEKPGGADKPPEDEEPPTPPREGYLRVFSDMLMERKRKKSDNTLPFNTDDFVENIDRTSEYVGSRGTVTDVRQAEDDSGITVIEYRVYNYGYSFKPGQKVSVGSASLMKIEAGSDAEAGS